MRQVDNNARRQEFWARMLPPQLAKTMAARERNLALYRASVAGATTKQLADTLGITYERVRELIHRGKREHERPERNPILRYFGIKGMRNVDGSNPEANAS